MSEHTHGHHGGGGETVGPQAPTGTLGATGPHHAGSSAHSSSNDIPQITEPSTQVAASSSSAPSYKPFPAQLYQFELDGSTVCHEECGLIIHENGVTLSKARGQTHVPASFISRALVLSPKDLKSSNSDLRLVCKDFRSFYLRFASSTSLRHARKAIDNLSASFQGPNSCGAGVDELYNYDAEKELCRQGNY